MSVFSNMLAKCAQCLERTKTEQADQRLSNFVNQSQMFWNFAALDRGNLFLKGSIAQVLTFLYFDCTVNQAILAELSVVTKSCVCLFPSIYLEEWCQWEEDTEEDPGVRQRGRSQSQSR